MLYLILLMSLNALPELLKTFQREMLIELLYGHQANFQDNIIMRGLSGSTSMVVVGSASLAVTGLLTALGVPVG